MELIHQDKIDNIAGCPAKTQTGEIKLFRFIHRDKLNDSFKPMGFSEKHKNDCIAWGLSTYNSEKVAKELLNNLPLKSRKKYNAIAFCVVNDVNGKKHQSCNHKNHYTFYPIKGFDFTSNFQIIEDGK